MIGGSLHGGLGPHAPAEAERGSNGYEECHDDHRFAQRLGPAPGELGDLRHHETEHHGRHGEDGVYEHRKRAEHDDGLPGNGPVHSRPPAPRSHGPAGRLRVPST